MPVYTEKTIAPHRGRMLAAKSGELIDIDTGEVVGGVDGHIQGVRFRKGKFGWNLNVRIVDDAGEDFVVTGSLDAFGGMTTWSRMLLGRLWRLVVSFGDELPKKRIRLEIHGMDTGKGQPATLCYLAIGDETEPVAEQRIETHDDLAAVMKMVAEALPWGGGDAVLPPRDDLEQFEVVVGSRPSTSTKPVAVIDAGNPPHPAEGEKRPADDDDLPF